MTLKLLFLVFISLISCLQGNLALIITFIINNNNNKN